MCGKATDNLPMLSMASLEPKAFTTKQDLICDFFLIQKLSGRFGGRGTEIFWATKQDQCYVRQSYGQLTNAPTITGMHM